MSFGWNFISGGVPTKFDEQYQCYSVALVDKAHLEGGDKILLPPSAFDTLARLNIEYPMLFRIDNPDKGTMTHCGVLEFTAEEGTMNIPFWMMQNLLVEEGGLLSITNVSLPKATFVKLQPQHVDFLEITNPKAVLEYALRNFSCVTKGDLICLPYNGKKYEFALKEVKPQDAACIIETDCNVDFDAPLGYKEPTKGSDNLSSASSNINPGYPSSLANLPKQSAYKDRNSATSSPAMSSMSGTSSAVQQETPEPPKIKIVDGKIVRQDDYSMSDSQTSGFVFENKTLMAERTGRTGVQKNAAIVEKAPEVDYWAINAGDGARLDGKVVSSLKDKDGNEIDIKRLRAEAAAKRLEAMKASQNLPSATTGITVSGKVVEIEGNVEKPPTVPVAKHKSRIGGKYSKIKQGGMAFGGAANHMEKK